MKPGPFPIDTNNSGYGQDPNLVAVPISGEPSFAGAAGRMGTGSTNKLKSLTYYVIAGRQSKSP